MSLLDFRRIHAHEIDAVLLDRINQFLQVRSRGPPGVQHASKPRAGCRSCSSSAMLLGYTAVDGVRNIAGCDHTEKFAATASSLNVLILLGVSDLCCTMLPTRQRANECIC